MKQTNNIQTPTKYQEIKTASEAVGFTMLSDLQTGTLLRTLVASKYNGRILELGTGTGLSLAWMVEGLGPNSQIISFDNDETVCQVARDHFGHHPQVEILCTDGSEWLQKYEGEEFDLIFADAWPGKFYDLEETLALLKPGGFYLIDDLKPTADWPEGHGEKVDHLVAYLEGREDLYLTNFDWSTGLILATKR